MAQSHPNVPAFPRPMAPAGGNRRRLAALIAAAWAVFAFFAGPARAAEEWDAFAVSGVPVDATAETAAAARDNALAAGQAAALERLFARLTLAVDRDKLPQVPAEAIIDLVKDFEVADEKTSAVRYLATMTVRFKPDVVRDLLRERGVGFAETRSKPLLILPVLDLAGALALWDDPNPWREAWSTLPASDGLVPIARPKGDLRDVALIGAEQAVRGDNRRLAAIARRYGASDVLVARAAMRFPEARAAVDGGSGPWLQVTLARFGTAQLEQTRIEAVFPNPGESQQALYARTAAAIADQIQESWKHNNRLRFDTGDEVTVEVPFDSLDQWVLIKSKLDTVPVIRRTQLIFLNRMGARLRVNFLGEEEQLRLALLQKDLVLERGATSMVLRPRSGGADVGDETTGAPRR